MVYHSCIVKVKSRLAHGIFMMCHVFIFGNQLTKMDKPIKQDDSNFVIQMLNISIRGLGRFWHKLISRNPGIHAQECMD